MPMNQFRAGGRTTHRTGRSGTPAGRFSTRAWVGRSYELFIAVVFTAVMVTAPALIKVRIGSLIDAVEERRRSIRFILKARRLSSEFVDSLSNELAERSHSGASFLSSVYAMAENPA